MARRRSDGYTSGRYAWILLLLVGCRRTAPQEAKRELVASVASDVSASPSPTPAAGAASAPSAAPPTPPAAACAVHPDLRWDADATHPLIRDLRSPGGYTVAPGTLTILAHTAYAPGIPGPDEEPSEARERATTALSLRYSALGLPKSATIDPATGEVTYRVALARAARQRRSPSSRRRRRTRRDAASRPASSCRRSTTTSVG
ncbi:MAG: hypothetical protein IPJ34_20315 [Myxococcales bacterium]|nr:hypothetical protein [Myxococcales bacterium]